ncbi:MAG: ATP-binding protein [Gammaproteobacteria bacterium]
MTAAHICFDSESRAVLVGREGGSGGGYVGRVAENCKGKTVFDSPVWLNTGFPNVIGIFGMRGTGKSFNLGVFAECLAGMPQVSAGDTLLPAIVIFDVQNQFWTLSLAPSAEHDKKHLDMLARWKLSPEAVPNIQCWTPAGAASHVLNAREYKIAPEQLAESDWLALLEQERYSPCGQALLSLLRNCKDRSPSTLLAIARTGGVLSDFQSSTIDALRWRLESIVNAKIIGSPGIDARSFLAPGKLSVVLLRGLPESMRALTAAILTRILSARMTDFHQQEKMAKRGIGKGSGENLPRRLWIMMDEAHVIAPREGRTSANEPMIDYVKRGRDSGLSLIFATQQPSAVDDKLMSQVDMTFTHALGTEADVQAAVARMPTSKPSGYKCGGESLNTPGDLIRSLKPGEAVLADAATQRPFIVIMRPRLSVHGGDTPD